MMSVVRTAAWAAAAALLVACSNPPTAQERAQATELAALAPLKQTYSGALMGFDFQGDTTLLASLDLNGYMGLDDDVQDAMKKAVLDRWRAGWVAAHPHERATLHVRFIDFVGKKQFEETVRV